MKFPAPDGHLIMELHGDQVEANHDSFTVFYSSDVTLNKYDQKVNYVIKMPIEQTQSATTATVKAINLKQGNINTDEKPFMINAGLDPKKSLDENFVYFYQNEYQFICFVIYQYARN